MADKTLPESPVLDERIDEEFTGVVLRKSLSSEKLLRYSKHDIGDLSDDPFNSEFSESFVRELQEEYSLDEMIEEKEVELEEQAVRTRALRHFDDSTDSLDFSDCDSSRARLSGRLPNHHDSKDFSEMDSSFVTGFQEYTIPVGFIDELLDELEYQERLTEALNQFDDTMDNSSFDEYHRMKLRGRSSI